MELDDFGLSIQKVYFQYTIVKLYFSLIPSFPKLLIYLKELCSFKIPWANSMLKSTILKLPVGPMQCSCQSHRHSLSKPGCDW